LDGEEHFESDKPWKKKRSLSGGSEDSCEYEDSEDSRTCKKARRSGKFPWLSRDSTVSFSQSISSSDNSSREDKNDDLSEHSRNNYEENSSVGVYYRCVCADVCVNYMRVGTHACKNAHINYMRVGMQRLESNIYLRKQYNTGYR
jgi:hypothetical protein